ncbi:hypothetical protein ACHAXS_011957 [Conticribra weissflogii]
MENSNIQDEASNNPYLQMRNEKIARNRKRLKELGLLTKTPVSESSTTTWKKSLPPLSQKRTLLPGQPLRRSARNQNTAVKRGSSLVDDGIIPENDATSTAKRQKISGREFVPKKEEIRKQNSTTARMISSSPTAPVSNNSVKSISLDIPKLLSKYLLTPLPTFGKEYVITTSFEEAAHDADKLRVAVSSSSTKRLSFNKYCGVQEWKNAIFLWVNIDNDASYSSSGYTNVFSKGGRHMTWYGGSNMREDSPIIRKLIRVGREAASLTEGNSRDEITTATAVVEGAATATTTTTTTMTTTSKSTSSSSLSDDIIGYSTFERKPDEDIHANIILWCRTYDIHSRKLTPYTCFGRLSYVKHEENSHPVAFEWNLLDYDNFAIGKDDKTDGVVRNAKGLLFFSMIGKDV